MRPRYLEVEGLQSFRELQVIDFDRLGETGLFGIFGPTGSGKSTILDAITLALYGSVVRAARGTQGIINTDENTLRVAFTFDLLKAGQRKTYRVERLYRRKKDSESSIEARMARLFILEPEGDRVIADKAGEVTGRVEELLGLELEDFTRSVVLPQNKFQEFLFMEKAKKREMLERIFYLEEYGRRLVEKVARGLSEVRLTLSSLGGAMTSLGDVSEKSLLEAERAVRSTREAREKADVELKLCETAYAEAKEVWDLQTELQALRDKEREHLAGLGAADAKRSMLEKAARAEGVIENAVRFRRISQSYKEVCEEYKQVCIKLEEAQKLMDAAQAGYTGFLEKAGVERLALAERKTRLSSALELKREEVKLGKRLDELRQEYISVKKQASRVETQAGDIKKDITEIEKQTEEANKAIAENTVSIDYRNAVRAGIKLQEELNSSSIEKDKAELKYNELSDAVNSLEQKLKELTAGREGSESVLSGLKLKLAQHTAAKPAHREKLQESREKLHACLLSLEAIKSADKSLERLREAAGAQEKAAKLLEANMEEAAVSMRLKEAALQAAREAAEKAQLEFEADAARSLSLRLKEGESCPVCGSLHHPGPAFRMEDTRTGHPERALEEARDSARQIAAACEEELRKAENIHIKFEEQYKSSFSRLEEMRSEIRSLEDNYAAALKQLPEEYRTQSPQEIEKLLSDEAERTAAGQKELEIWETELEEIKGSITASGEELARQSAEENGLKSELKVNTENLAALKSALDEAMESCSLKGSAFTEFVHKYGISAPVEELSKIEGKDRLVDKRRLLEQQLRQKAKELSEKLVLVTEERHALGNRLTDLDADGRNAKSHKTEICTKTSELTGGLSDEQEIEAAASAADESLKSLAEKEAELSSGFKNSEEAFRVLAGSKTELSGRREVYGTELEQLGTLLEQQLKERGFDSIEALESAVLNREKRELLERDVNEYDRIRNNIRAGISLYEKRLGGRSVAEEEWNSLGSKYIAKQQQKEFAISAQENARNIFHDLKSRFERWLELEKEFKKHKKQESLLEQLQKLFKGNSFIEFISEERLRYVAKEASETLGFLTKHRYALELDTENGFMVRDNSNGGALRMAATLSGGETFLTSLSLALALSKQIQLKGQSPLEFFFLDEGFGTLDGGLLDTVMDALERFSSAERVIGLISHLPEMRNRIARRLVVEPASAGGRGSRVRIEKA